MNKQHTGFTQTARQVAMTVGLTTRVAQTKNGKWVVVEDQVPPYNLWVVVSPIFDTSLDAGRYQLDMLRSITK